MHENDIIHDQHISRLRDLREEDNVQRKQKSNSSSGNLPISQPGDASEKEADSIAKKVTNGEHAPVNSTINAATISTKSEGENTSASPEFASQLIQTKGGGQSIDESTRGEMESKMGTDFSDVKIHNDNHAQSMSTGINAKAFTHGHDIYFGDGNYNPQSKDGKELLAHELVHTKQQNNMVQPMIQRHVDPKEVVPNKGDTRLTNKEDQGAQGYMPHQEQFKLNFAAQPTRDAKIALIDNFINEFFGYYKELSDPLVSIFQKSLNIKTLADQVDKSNEIRGFPLTDFTTLGGTRLQNSNADWGKFKPSNPDKKHEGYASMMVLDQAANKEALDLLELKKVNEMDYKLQLGAKIDSDATGDLMADLATSLRRVGDHVNRLYAVYSTSQATGMAFNDIMAFYGQESFFTMPSSSGSLVNQIPVMENAGVSVANTDSYYFDFSTMNLTVPQSHAWLKSVSAPVRQVWALLIYSLQISGSDVVFQRIKGQTTLDGWLNALAAWSLENRKGSKDVPTVELAGTDAELLQKLKDKWWITAQTISELTPEHRKASTINTPDLDKVWMYAPSDPAKMTSFILTESAFLLKAYQSRPASIFGGDLMFDTPLAYMMYNSTTNNTSGEGYMKSIISSAVSAAIVQSKLPLSGSGAMTDAFKKELAFLNGKSDITSVTAWINAKPVRWEMLMDFMQKASQEEWKPTYKNVGKMRQRVNSSNFRTLSEFYEKVME